MPRRASPRRKATDWRDLVDLTPSLEVRLEAARDLYLECVASRDCTDPARQSDLLRRALLCSDGSCDFAPHPVPVSHTTFGLHRFLEDNGVDAWALRGLSSPGE